MFLIHWFLTKHYVRVSYTLVSYKALCTCFLYIGFLQGITYLFLIHWFLTKHYVLVSYTLVFYKALRTCFLYIGIKVSGYQDRSRGDRSPKFLTPNPILLLKN